MGKMIRDKEGKSFYVPTVWQINNVHFTRKKFKYLIDTETANKMNHIPYTVFCNAKLGKHFLAYERSCTPHYKKVFRPRLSNLMIRGLILFLDNPQHYGHNPKFIIMKVISYWLNILFTRIVMSNRFGAEIQVPDDSIKMSQSTLHSMTDLCLNCYLPIAEKLLPKYKRLA